MASPFSTNNPGIGGLDELTASEEATIAIIDGLGTAGQVLTTNVGATAVEWATNPAGVTTFIALSDTPGAYTGEALKVVRVNAGETALEFITLAGGGDALTTDPLSQFAATTSLQLAGVISDETGTGSLVFATSPTLVTPALGTPASGIMTNITGTASGFTAGNVTTNANLTGHITSIGNAAVLGSFTLAQLNTAISDGTVIENVEGTAVLSTGEAGGVKYLREDGDGTCSWQTVAGSGDVTATVNMTDNTLVKGDGGAKGIQDTGITISDNDAVVITIANTSNEVGLLINQDDTTNEPLAAEFRSAYDGGTAVVRVVAEDNGNFTGPALDIFYDKATPTDSDTLGLLTFSGKNSVGADTTYGRILAYSLDVTDTTEDGMYNFSVMSGGSLLNMLQIDGANSVIKIGSGGASQATLSTLGNIDLVLQTGNATTGSITITDGANGAINLTPDGTGEAQVSGQKIIDESDKTGLDAGIVSGTAGTSGNLPQWNADGDLVDAGFSVTTGTPGKGSLLVGDGTADYDEVTAGTNDQVVVYDSVQTNGIKAVDLDSGINFIIDGGGSVITTGVKGYIEIPFDCTVESVTLLADVSGSIVVDLWKDTYANYPPLDADSITASAVPTITTATKSQDSTLTGWTTTFTKGDIIGYNVDSITTCTRVTLSLKVRRNF